jgi:hypothetical protein
MSSLLYKHAEKHLFRSFSIDAFPHLLSQHNRQVPKVRQVVVATLENQRKRLRAGLNSVCMFTFAATGGFVPLQKLITKSTNFAAKKKSIGVLGVQSRTRTQLTKDQVMDVNWIWPFVLTLHKRYVFDAQKIPHELLHIRPKYDDIPWQSLTMEEWLDPEERKKNYLHKRYIESSSRWLVRMQVAFESNLFGPNMAYLHFFRLPISFTKSRRYKERGTAARVMIQRAR